MLQLSGKVLVLSVSPQWLIVVDGVEVSQRSFSGLICLLDDNTKCEAGLGF